MRSLIVIVLISVLVAMSSSFTGKNAASNFQELSDSLEVERTMYVNQVLESIKGKEKMNVDSVYKNLKSFKGSVNFKASHFLGMMKYWGKSLGVSCTYCHNPNDWSSDEKLTKQIAREMWTLRQLINKQMLVNIKGLQPKATVNCGTCHQGRIIPPRD